MDMRRCYDDCAPQACKKQEEQEELRARIIIQGAPKPSQMSKMLLPIAFAMAMSPMPCRATTSDAMQSGMLVPAARTVTPYMKLMILELPQAY